MIAFKTSDPEILLGWSDFLGKVEVIREKRNELEESYGRRLLVRRSGFGHGNSVVGFERFDSDNDGDIVGGDGELVALKSNPKMLTPNRRRKRGRDLEEHLKEYDMPGPVLAEMPEMHFAGSHMLAPALMMRDGKVYAAWTSESVREEIELGKWVEIPLSEYYAAVESAEKEEA